MHQLFSCCDKPPDGKQLKGGGDSLGSRVGGQVHHDGQSMTAMDEAAVCQETEHKQEVGPGFKPQGLPTRDPLHSEGISL